MDTESIAESMQSEQNSFMEQVVPTNNVPIPIQTNLTMDVDKDVKITQTNLLDSRSLSISNKSLASSTASTHQLKANPIENKVKPKLPTPTPAIKKGSEEFSKKSIYYLFFFSTRTKTIRPIDTYST
jgi:hypothetical protein